MSMKLLVIGFGLVLAAAPAEGIKLGRRVRVYDVIGVVDYRSDGGSSYHSDEGENETGSHRNSMRDEPDDIEEPVKNFVKETETHPKEVKPMNPGVTNELNEVNEESAALNYQKFQEKLEKRALRAEAMKPTPLTEYHLSPLSGRPKQLRQIFSHLAKAGGPDEVHERQGVENHTRYQARLNTKAESAKMASARELQRLAAEHRGGEKKGKQRLSNDDTKKPHLWNDDASESDVPFETQVQPPSPSGKRDLTAKTLKEHFPPFWPLLKELNKYNRK